MVVLFILATILSIANAILSEDKLQKVLMGLSAVCWFYLCLADISW